MKALKLLILFMLFTSPAHAAPPDTRAWAKGVSAAEQEKALALFNEATDKIKDSLFKKAVDLYLEALTHWDHPAIHFNVAKALMALDDNVAAYNHLGASMKFGGQPLTPDEQEQVTRYKKLLYDTELAEVHITCSEPDAQVTLNGDLLFTGPGSWQGVVRPQNVSLIASKPGFQTTQSKPSLKKGQLNDVSLALTPLDDSQRYTRAFGTWIPWTVIAAGVVMAGGGAVAHWQQGEQVKAYDDAIAQCRSTAASNSGAILDTGGVARCIPGGDIRGKLDDAKLMKTLAIAGYAAGGATLATGLVLLYVNRQKPVTVEGTVDVETPVTVIPYVGPAGAGVAATVGF